MWPTKAKRLPTPGLDCFSHQEIPILFQTSLFIHRSYSRVSLLFRFSIPFLSKMNQKVVAKMISILVEFILNILNK